jgi:hypothetical protein
VTAAPIVAEIHEEAVEAPVETAPAPASVVATTAAAAGTAADANDVAAIVGRISGSGLDAVVSVIAYGPDNVLREAARVVPRADGSFAFTKLAPGAYRIVLDGGGDRLIESTPPFQVVRVGDGGGAIAQPFTIVRVR